MVHVQRHGWSGETQEAGCRRRAEVRLKCHDLVYTSPQRTGVTLNETGFNAEVQGTKREIESVPRRTHAR
jgi:hypothetical protein